MAPKVSQDGAKMTRGCAKMVRVTVRPLVRSPDRPTDRPNLYILTPDQPLQRPHISSSSTTTTTNTATSSSTTTAKSSTVVVVVVVVL